MSPSADRLVAAEVRATNAYRSVCHKAEALLEELDEVTDPTGAGIPRVEIHEEDSLVIVVTEAHEQHKRAARNR